jgi:hypothetical protein
MAVQQVTIETVQTLRAEYVEFTGDRYEDVIDVAESKLNEYSHKGSVVTWQRRGSSISAAANGGAIVTVKYLVIRPQGTLLDPIC